MPFEEADYVVCTGLLDDVHDKLEDYDPLLRHMRERNMEFICANPDIVVHSGERLIYCAGAIAERYAALGGRVIQAGKPYPEIYRRAIGAAVARAARLASLASSPSATGSRPISRARSMPGSICYLSRPAFTATGCIRRTAPAFRSIPSVIGAARRIRRQAADGDDRDADLVSLTPPGREDRVDLGLQHSRVEGLDDARRSLSVEPSMKPKKS